MAGKFRGRPLLVASMHGKERAIASVLEQALGVTCFTDHSFDTDQFGSFTGEIRRSGTPLETVRKKCLAGMEGTGCDLGIATEATFGPHPDLWMIPSHHEIIQLIDNRLGLDIHVSGLTTDTNFSSAEVTTQADLLAFAKRASFPSHALVLRGMTSGFEEVRKGLNDHKKLMLVFRWLSMRHSSLRVETDMRAHFNPTRMNFIRELTGKLLTSLMTECPACQTPGFGIEEPVAGLPCSACGTPTRSTLKLRTACSRCHHVTEKLHPHNKYHEDPKYCPACNP